MDRLFSTTARRQVSRLARSLKAVILVFFIAGDVFLFGYVGLHGSEARNAADQQIQKDIDQEDHAACAELGLGSGSAFDACAQELAHVREREQERLDDASPF
jgi:hypothetical protein